LHPKRVCDLERIDAPSPPPHLFVASLVQLPMMTTTERHSELIAHFETDRSLLRKTQMMRIGWAPTADKTRLRRYEF